MTKQFVNNENTKHRGEDPYADVIRNIGNEGVCPFCPDNLEKYHKEPILESGEFWVATPNMYPYAGANHHLLLIHREHIEDIAEVTLEAWEELRFVIAAMSKRLSIHGASLLMRYGETKHTGASVAHLHAQLISGSGEKDAPPVLTRVG